MPLVEASFSFWAWSLTGVRWPNHHPPSLKILFLGLVNRALAFSFIFCLCSFSCASFLPVLIALRIFRDNCNLPESPVICKRLPRVGSIWPGFLPLAVRCNALGATGMTGLARFSALKTFLLSPFSALLSSLLLGADGGFKILRQLHGSLQISRPVGLQRQTELVGPDPFHVVFHLYYRVGQKSLCFVA